MKWIEKMKYKHGKKGIPNLPNVMIACFIIGYVLYFLFPDIYSLVTLNPYQVFVDKQYWRFFTWILTVPITPGRMIDYVLIPICLYFYYFVAKQLEYIWGTLMFNIYILGQMLILSVAVLVIALITNRVSMLSLPGTRYMVLSMYLALAVIFPDMRVLFMFIIPVKMKWMALVDLGFCLYEFMVFPDVYWRATIIVCVGVYGLFYFINKRASGPSMADLARRRKFQKAVREGEKQRMQQKSKPVQKSETDNVVDMRNRFKPVTAKGKAIHKCAVCGRTELDDETLDFRYCSKCTGDKEYCSDHIFTHSHE